MVKTKQDIMPSYNTESSTIYDTKKWKDQLRSLMASCEIAKAMLKEQALKQSKLTLNLLTTTIVVPPSNTSKWQMGFNSAFKGLIQLYKVSCTRFTTIH